MEKDDLLNIKPKRSIKKTLIYGAIAFLVFIIGIIIYAIYSNSNQENVVIPPQVNETPKQTNEFKEVPIEENTNILSQKLIKNNEEKNTSIENSNIKNSPNVINKNENSVIKNKPEEKKEIKNTKEVIKIKTSNISKKNINTKFYIQVAALIKYKKPDKKFLNLIKKEGFNYKIYKTYITKNGKKIPITKILIGPYESEIKARKTLKKVKEKITQNAFIFKVK